MSLHGGVVSIRLLSCRAIRRGDRPRYFGLLGFLAGRLFKGTVFQGTVRRRPAQFYLTLGGYRIGALADRISNCNRSNESQAGRNGLSPYLLE